MAFEELDWDRLLSRIEDNTCTPFIGAGACACHLPSGSELARALAEESEYPLAEGESDLSRVTQFMAVDHRDAQFPKRAVSTFFQIVRPQGQPARFKYGSEEIKFKRKGGLLQKLYESRRIPDFAEDTNSPHAVLSAVNSSIYLTTNYDDFMLMALHASRREAVKDFCRWTPTLLSDRSALAANFQPSPEHALVYHLHGHADEPRSIVVTEDDYLDFTVQVARDLARSKGHIGQNVMLPGYVRKAITNNLLLFVGYSVRDQNLRVVLRTLWQALTPASDRLNIAIQLRLEPGVTGADIDRIKTYLERHYEVSLKLQVYWGEAREFAAELRKRL